MNKIRRDNYAFSFLAFIVVVSAFFILNEAIFLALFLAYSCSMFRLIGTIDMAIASLFTIVYFVSYIRLGGSHCDDSGALVEYFIISLFISLYLLISKKKNRTTEPDRPTIAGERERNAKEGTRKMTW